MIIEQLREVSVGFHEHLHEALEEASQGRISHGHYRAVLRHFLGFIRPFERQCRATCGEAIAVGEIAFPLADKSSLLAADLIYLGLSEEEVAQAPECGAAVPTDVGDLLGGLYVTEGSSLGGRVIARALQKSPAFAGQDCIRFFSSHGIDVPARWSRFSGFMTDVVAATPELEPKIIAGATRAFAAYDRWLQELDLQKK